MKKTLTIFFLSISFFSFSQSEKEKLAAIEEARILDRQRLVMLTLDSAVNFMNAGEYKTADIKFLYVLKHIKSVPSDLTYYFGENSYHMGLYRQCIDWLNKYIQLKGTTGKFSDDAVLYMKKAEAELITVRKNEAVQAKQILSQDYDIDCGSAGKVVCPVCTGTTVVVKKNYLNETYKTCGYCHKLGYLSCEEYNKLLRGQLQAANN